MNNSDINRIASVLLEDDIAHDDIRELADTWNNSEELQSELAELRDMLEIMKSGETPKLTSVF